MADPVQLPLPTFVVSPDATGRGYELSSKADLRERWTVDLPMIMLAWSQLNIEQPFACSIDFGEGLVICRGHFLRKLASGNSIALLAGVVITNAQAAKINHRTDLLAASIPLPLEGTDFAVSPHVFEFARNHRSSSNWPSDDLSWGRRFIRHDAGSDAKAVLTKFFDAVEPTGQHATFRTWTTTDTLPAKGGIDLASQAQLIISRRDEPAELPFQNARVRAHPMPDGKVDLRIGEIESSGPPPSRRAYIYTLALAQQHLGETSEVSWPKWSLKYIEAKPVAVARRVALKIIEQLDLARAYGFLAAMLGHKTRVIQEAGQSASMTLLEHVTKGEGWEAGASELIAKLPDKEPVFGLVLIGKELKSYNSNFLKALAKIATDTLDDSKRQSKTQPSLRVFAVEYARLTKDLNLPVDSALGLVQSLHESTGAGDSGVVDIRDVLTPETVSQYAEYDGAQLADVTASLMDAEFFDLGRLPSVSAALGRVSTALAALDRMAR